MEPIISPWIFYWMDVAEGLSVLAAIASIFGTMSMIIIVATYDDETEESVSHMLKLIAVGVAIALALCVFIPSKDTMYKMLVTSYITPNNIELVGGSIDTALDKLTDKVVKIKEAK